MNFLDIQLQLSKLEKAAVTRICCSNKHALAVTNTGSVFAWGENDNMQLGYATPKKNSQGLTFESKPRRLECLAKEFIIDAACGDNQSLVLTNSKQVFLWGSNKHCQLGFDPESHLQVSAPKQLIIQEYMNSAVREVFS